MKKLLEEIKKCQLCDDLPLGPRPVLSAHPKSKIVLIGQAPGSVVHKSGIPWDDKSGDNLRDWMGLTKDDFYNPQNIAILPMGFCYPGRGKSGDLPPRKVCAPQWHHLLWNHFQNVQLTLLVGKYAQDYYLRQLAHPTLTATVYNYASYLPEFFVLPHPSPRNNIWMAKNPWFKQVVLPDFKKAVANVLNTTE